MNGHKYGAPRGFSVRQQAGQFWARKRQQYKSNYPAKAEFESLYMHAAAKEKPRTPAEAAALMDKTLDERMARRSLPNELPF
jgi:hypothetical protein